MSIARTIALVVAKSLSALALAQPLPTAFTYQGMLDQSGAPASGVFDLRFRLYDSAAGGTQVGSTLCIDNMTVSGGRFAATLDFGAVFAGQRRWLEIEVRADTGLACSNATGFTALAPRQELTATPHAAFALNATTATSAATAGNATQLNGQSASFYTNAANLNAGILSDARLGGVYTGQLTFSNASNLFLGSGAGLTGLNASSLASGVVPDARLPGALARRDAPNTFSAINTFSADTYFNGGNVGIGTPTPSNPLAVVGATLLNGPLHVGSNPANPIEGVTINSGRQVSVAAAGEVVAAPGGGASGRTASIVGGGTIDPYATSSTSGARVDLGGGFHFISLATGGAASLRGGDATNFGVGGPVTISGGLSSAPTGLPGKIVVNPGGREGIPPTTPVDGYVVISNRLQLGETDGLLRFNRDSASDRWDIAHSGASGTGLTFTPAGRVGIATPAPAERLHVTGNAVVSGSMTAASFSGAGGALTALNASSLSTGTLPGARLAGTYGDVLTLNNPSNAIFGSFQGNGANITSLNATSLTTGTVSDSRLSSNVARRNASNTFNADQFITFGGLGIGTTGPLSRTLHVAGDALITSDLAVSTLNAGGASVTGNLGLGIAFPSGRIHIMGTAGPPGALPASENGLLLGSNGTSSYKWLQSYGGDICLNAIGNDVSIGNTNARHLFHVGPTGGVDAFNLAGTRGAVENNNANGRAVWLALAGNGTTPTSADRVEMQFEAEHSTTASNRRGIMGTASSHRLEIRTNNSGRINVDAAGAVTIPGTLSKGGGSFMIDHPLDPENKYLFHSFVESPDMMNIYNGIATTDERGYASVSLPDWFEALNRDFRYQLTVVDDGELLPDFVMTRVVRRIEGGRFVIKTSLPGVEVSWQVTGIRKDAFAEAHRIRVEVDKEPPHKGLYLHPEALGMPASLGIYSVNADAKPTSDPR